MTTLKLFISRTAHKDFFIFSKGVLQTPNNENIEKKLGFPGELLNKEHSKLANCYKLNNQYDNFKAIYFENSPLRFFYFW